VWIDAKEAYTRFCSQDIFNAGQSGVMTIPTEDAHNGWADGLHFNIKGAQFKMVAVEGGTFTMGDPESTDEYYTAHKVTLTGYCIGETEVTSLLYTKLNNTSTSYPNRAYDVDSDSHITSNIINKINVVEDVCFDLPTEAQWEFAAKGGVKSKGYKYSGSDNIDEVSWYKGNCNSVQDVKLKLPNELGLYDMSGNLSEKVKDRYSPYPSSNQIDPLVTNGSNAVYRGGEYYLDGVYCYVHYRSTYSNVYKEGCRLALNWND
jgi:formylglycine-generating enzyme required for sulfatase activity